MTLAIAVDWSGAKAQGGARGIAIAIARPGRLIDVIPGPASTKPLNRSEAISFVIDTAKAHDGNVVAGLDFAFSLPGWYLEARGLDDAPALWRWARAEGEGWWEGDVGRLPSPFWRADGAGKPHFAGMEEFRATEMDETLKLLAGSSPQSAFRLSGQGSVGSSTVRGLPHLADLKDAGFCIWPWDSASAPLALEVWPRIAVRDVAKSNPAARVERIAQEQDAGRIGKDLAVHACADDNAFDAALTALWLADNAGQLLGEEADPACAPGGELAREGRIWTPGSRGR